MWAEPGRNVKSGRPAGQSRELGGGYDGLPQLREKSPDLVSMWQTICNPGIGNDAGSSGRLAKDLLVVPNWASLQTNPNPNIGDNWLEIDQVGGGVRGLFSV